MGILDDIIRAAILWVPQRCTEDFSVILKEGLCIKTIS